HDLSFGVLRVGGGAEGDGAGVFLVRAHQKLGELGRLAEQHDEQAGGHGVARAGVADALHFENAAQAGDHVVRGVFGRLVDEEHAVVVGGGSAHQAEGSTGTRATCSAMAAMSLERKSSRETPFMLSPAAQAWPPPLKRAAMRSTR